MNNTILQSSSFLLLISSVVLADRVVDVNIRIRTPLGEPLAGKCVYVIQPEAAHAGKTDAAGNTTIAVPLEAGQSDVVVTNANRNLPIVWSQGQAVPCDALFFHKDGYVARLFQVVPVPTQATSVTMEYTLQPAVKASMRIVDGAGQPILDSGTAVLGYLSAGLQDESGRITLAVPKGEPFRLWFSVSKRASIREFAAIQSDTDLGDLAFQPVPMSAPVEITCEADPGAARSGYGAVVLVGKTNQVVVSFHAVAGRGFIGGNLENGTTRVPPGEYHVIPGSFTDREVIQFIDKVHGGNAPTDPEIPTLVAVEGELRRVHVLGGKADRALRRAIAAAPTSPP